MSERIITRQRQHQFVYTDLRLLEYEQALNIQTNAVTAKIENPNQPDLIFMVEHPSIFTIGKNSKPKNLIVSKAFLASKDIKVVQTRRGGDITYHGPGQAVMYPIIDLEKNKIGVKDFVYGLEEIMILTVKEFGLHAQRSEKNQGIWIENKKIGSVGLGIKKGVCFHGIALNINTDLTPFSWINPCGLTDIFMTSMQNELDRFSKKQNQSTLKFSILDLSMQLIKDRFKKHFCSVFNFLEIKQ